MKMYIIFLVLLVFLLIIISILTLASNTHEYTTLTNYSIGT